MTRLTSEERRAIELTLLDLQVQLDHLVSEMGRLRAMLAAQPDGSDGDTLRLLRALCACGLPLDHRHPITGEPRPCEDETARIALATERRSRPPVPSSVTGDESWLCSCGHAMASHEAVLGTCRRCGPSRCATFRATL